MRQLKNQTRFPCRAWLLWILSAAIAWGNQPPAIFFFNPPGGTLLSEGDSIQLQAQATDPENGLAKVQFYANGSLVGEDLLPPYSVWWSNVSTGLHRLQAVAVDDALARGTSSTVTVTVTAPGPQTLEWHAPPNVPPEWNGTTINWRSTSGQLSSTRATRLPLVPQAQRRSSSDRTVSPCPYRLPAPLSEAAAP